MIKFSKICTMAALVCFFAIDAFAVLPGSGLPDFPDDFKENQNTGGGIGGGSTPTPVPVTMLCSAGSSTSFCSAGTIVSSAEAVEDDNGGLHVCYTCKTPDPCDYGALAYKDSNNNIVKCGCN